MILFFIRLADCLRFSLFSTSTDHPLRMVPGRPFLCGLLAPYLRTWQECSASRPWVTLGPLCPRFKQFLLDPFLSPWTADKLSSFGG
ncbi:unnamed protein product, partial [Citrullus colocynthis]